MEWFPRHPHYTYIRSNLSNKQFNKLTGIMTALENGNLKVYNHVLLYNGRLMGIDLSGIFYISHNSNYTPCGAEIAVYKWLSTMGVDTDEMLCEIVAAVRADGELTKLGEIWSKASELPSITQLCYAQIIGTLTEDGYQVKTVKKANIIGSIKSSGDTLYLHEVLFCGVDGYAYLTRCGHNGENERFYQPIIVKEGYAYIRYKNKLLCFSNFK